MIHHVNTPISRFRNKLHFWEAKSQDFAQSERKTLLGYLRRNLPGSTQSHSPKVKSTQQGHFALFEIRKQTPITRSTVYPIFGCLIHASPKNVFQPKTMHAKHKDVYFVFTFVLDSIEKLNFEKNPNRAK